MEPTGTRQRLLAATIEVIEQRGEQAVRVRDVAAAVGVAEPSIYHFFGSREGLLDEAQLIRYERSRGDLVEAFRLAVRRCTSAEEFREVVRTALAGFTSPTRDAARAVRTEVLGLAQVRPALAARLLSDQRTAVSLVASAIGFAQRKGWVRYDLDPDAFGAWVFGQVNGRTLVELDPDHVDGDAWNRLALEGVLAALAVPEVYGRGA